MRPIGSPSIVMSKKQRGLPRSLSVLSIVPPGPYTFSSIQAVSASIVSYFSFIEPPSSKSLIFVARQSSEAFSSDSPQRARISGEYSSLDSAVR